MPQLCCVECHKDRSLDRYCSYFTLRTYCSSLSVTTCVHICTPTTRHADLPLLSSNSSLTASAASICVYWRCGFVNAVGAAPGKYRQNRGPLMCVRQHINFHRSPWELVPTTSRQQPQSATRQSTSTQTCQCGPTCPGPCPAASPYYASCAAFVGHSTRHSIRTLILQPVIPGWTCRRRRYLYPVRSYWHFFRNTTWRQPILDFQVMWIWLFRHDDSVVFVLCTKFGSNICYSHWDRCTYASEFHLMTSRELTSVFDFWSCGHLRMAVMHLHIKFGADIFIQSGVVDIFPRLKMAAAAILDLLGSHGTSHEGTLVARTPCKNFVMIG